MATHVDVRVFITDDGFPLAGVSVQLEALISSRPRPLGTALTNAAGEANFTLPSPFDIVSELLQRLSVRASLIDASGRVIRSLSRAIRRGAKNRIALGLSGVDYVASSLVPPRPDQRQARMAHICRTLTNEAGTPLGKENLCLMHAVLGSVTRLSSPQSDLERQVAKLVRSKFGRGAEVQAVRVAQDMLKSLKACNLPPEVDCTDTIDLDGMGARMFGGSNPIYPGLQELARRAQPDPASLVGPQREGFPFTTPYKPSDSCATQYLQDFPNGTDILAPPTVNLIEGWDPGLQSYVREGQVGPRQLVATALDTVHGWHTKTTDMNRPVTHSRALLMVADDDPASTVVPIVAYPQTGNQVLAVDVRPGLKIRLSGANFIADSCTVSAEYRAWDNPVERKLVPDAVVRRAVGLDGLQLTVHGDNSQPPAGSDVITSSRDEIVFEWPAAAAAEGLYSLHLSFANGTSIPTTMVHDASCGTTPDFGPARSQVLHFVILPDVRTTAATVRLTEVECAAKNSLVYDNVQTLLQGVTTRFAIDSTGTGLEGTVVDESSGSFSRLVFQTPAVWDPALQSYPANAPRPLRPDEWTVARLEAMDMPDAIGNIVVAIILFAIFVAAVSLILLLLSIVVGLVLLIVLSGGTATVGLAAIFAAIVAGSFSLSGTLITLLAGALGGLYALVLATFNAEPIGTVDISFGGSELAHLTSEFRFHEAIWTVPRTSSVRTGGGMDLEDRSINSLRVRERWDSTAGGGDYLFTTEARPS